MASSFVARRIRWCSITPANPMAPDTVETVSLKTKVHEEAVIHPRPRAPMTSRFGPFALLLLLLLAPAAGAQWTRVDAPTTTSLRGVSVPSPRVVWVSGARGTVARSVDAGATWRLVNVPGADSLDFRDVEAFGPDTALVLSIGNGAQSRIYRTTDGGATWTLQFTNPDSAAFYDCFAFWDSRRGIAMSDPVGGRFRIITTADGGVTWTPVPPENVPPALAGEAGFAASGTCLATHGNGLGWLVSGGGARARAYRTVDHGRTWQVSEIPPITAGAGSRGAFSVTALDALTLVAVGGDYEKPSEASGNVAISTDGGITWRAPRGRLPAGYRSGVAAVQTHGDRALVAVGTSGTDISVDWGDSWVTVDSLPLNAVAFLGEEIGWGVGPRGVVARWNRGGRFYIRRKKDGE